MHPKRLKTLASNVEYAKGNNLLHQFVLDNSPPHQSRNETYLNAHLLAISSSSLSVNALNGEGYSPLHLAVLKNNVLMTKKLLSCLSNIDVNTRCDRRKDENSALHLAVKLGHLDIVEALLDKEASIDITANEFGQTALCLAVRSGDFAIIELLVRKGANVNAKDNYNNTLLHYAVLYGNLNIFQFLLNNGGGGDINAKNKTGKTPLHCAITHRTLEIAKVLLDNGADFNAVGEYGRTLLHHAVYLRRLDSLSLLIDKGANMNAKDEYGRTPLHRAVLDKTSASIEVTKMLIERGADVNATDVYGNTALHHLFDRTGYCISYEDYLKDYREKLMKIKLLLEGSADVNIKDKEGRTPLGIARQSENSELIELFSESETKLKSI